jgi:lipid-binding SYLF domain-containing protein
MKAIRQFSAIVFAGVLAACAAQTEGEKAVERSTLEQQAKASLTELYGFSETARALAPDANGILVFPQIVEAGFIVGGETGDGVLFVNEKPLEYYDVSGLSVGFQAGGQAYSQVLMFMTPEVLERFRNAAGFELGADAGVTVVDADVAGAMNTSNLQNDIVAFVFGASGLAGGVAVDGTKYTKKDL